VFAQVSSVRSEEQNGAVQRAALTFNDPNDKMYTLIPSDPGQVVDFTSRNIDGAVPVPPELLASGRRAITYHGSKCRTARVSRYERFREDD